MQTHFCSVLVTLSLNVKLNKTESNELLTWWFPVNRSYMLTDELRRLVESRMKSNLQGIEETLLQIFASQKPDLEELRQTIEGLEKSFELLSEKWTLQILYILFLRGASGFGDLKKILNVNSRTLSDKLRNLTECAYLTRAVDQGPPLRVKYSLTARGRNTILLALPFLYYASSNLT